MSISPEFVEWAKDYPVPEVQSKPDSSYDSIPIDPADPWRSRSKAERLLDWDETTFEVCTKLVIYLGSYYLVSRDDFYRLTGLSDN